MADRIRISRRKEYREKLYLYLNLTKKLNAKLKKFFKKYAIKASTKYKQGIFLENIYLLEFTDELYKILANHYRVVIEVNAERLVRQRYKKASQEVDTIIAEYVAVHTATEVTYITDTTLKKLKKTIKNGLTDGDSIDDISRNIKKSNAFSTTRATLIARTETHSAMNEGNLAITKTLALNNPVKEWNNAMDGRSRYWHKSMDTGKPIPIDEDFVVLTPTKYGAVEKRMSYAGDSRGGAINVCNCRCFITYYDEEDEVIGNRPKPVSPIVNVDDTPLIPPQKLGFVGLGYKTKLEKKYLNESFKKGDVPDRLRELPAKFDPVDFTQQEKEGAYFFGLKDGQVDKINMPLSYKDYNKIATTRHEYGHNIDFQSMQFLVYDRRRTNNPSRSWTGWGTGTDQAVTAKNKVSAKAIKLRAEVNATNEYNMQKLRFASQVYSKEVLEDAIALEKMIKAKAINDYSKYTLSPYANLDKKLKAHREQIKKKYKVESVLDEQLGYVDERLIFNNDSEKMAFLDDMFEDGIFTKKELKILFGDDVNVPISLNSKLIKFNYYNKNKLFGNSQNVKAGAVGKLQEVADELLSGKDNIRRSIIKKDVDYFDDYVGAITKEKIGSGHGVSYYEKASLSRVKMGRRVITENQTTEAYAEYISLRMSKYNKLWENKMTEYAPRTKAGFDELTEEMLKLPNQKNKIIDKRSMTFYRDQE